jgi:hypothetical protein
MGLREMKTAFYQSQSDADGEFNPYPAACSLTAKVQLKPLPERYRRNRHYVGQWSR